MQGDATVVVGIEVVAEFLEHRGVGIRETVYGTGGFGTLAQHASGKVDDIAHLVTAVDGHVVLDIVVFHPCGVGGGEGGEVKAVAPDDEGLQIGVLRDVDGLQLVVRNVEPHQIRVVGDIDACKSVSGSKKVDEVRIVRHVEVLKTYAGIDSSGEVVAVELLEFGVLRDVDMAYAGVGDVKDGEQGVVCDAEAADRCGIDGNLPQVRASRGVEGVQVVAAPGIECDH